MKAVIFVKYCENSRPSVNPFLNSKVGISELFPYFLCTFVVEEGATARSNFVGAMSLQQHVVEIFIVISVKAEHFFQRFSCSVPQLFDIVCI